MSLNNLMHAEDRVLPTDAEVGVVFSNIIRTSTSMPQLGADTEL